MRHLPALPLAIASALCLSIAPASPAAAQSGELPDTARVQLLLRDGQWIDGRIDTLDSASCTVFRADAGVQAHVEHQDVANRAALVIFRLMKRTR